jgi:hypothetical protein
LEAIKNSSWAVEFIPDELKDDPEINFVFEKLWNNA